MHAQPPRTLKRLLKQYGQELIDDPRRTEALLRDHCGQHTREIFVLVNAQKQRVPNELLAAPPWMPRQAITSRLSRLLQTKLALTEDAADWAVTSWATALELEAADKSNAWSWLPGKTRAKNTSGKHKSRGKKRQNTSSGVQYRKKNARQGNDQGNEQDDIQGNVQAGRTMLGWGLPKVNFAHWQQLAKTPAVWANLLPWFALLSATIFLLIVVYWTSSTRDTGQTSSENGEVTTPISATQIASDASVSTPSTTAVPPILDLPEPPGIYLRRVMPLPTWANVNVADEPLLVRQEPTTAAPYLSVLQDGTAVNVIGFSDDGRWSQIRSPYRGWVSNDFLLFISADATHSAVRLGVQQLETRYDVKVVAAPAANGAEIATLSRGETVIIAASVGEPATWYQLADPDVGWIAANDLAPISP